MTIVLSYFSVPENSVQRFSEESFQKKKEKQNFRKKEKLKTTG